MYRTRLKFKNYDPSGEPRAPHYHRYPGWTAKRQPDHLGEAGGTGGQMLAGARYESDYTIELVRESGVFNLHPLAQSQTALIQKLGRKSGRGGDKFKRLPHALDARGCPYLGKTIGYVSCRVTGTGAAGDHTILRRGVPRRVILNPDQPVLTHHYLRQKGWVRG